MKVNDHSIAQHPLSRTTSPITSTSIRPMKVSSHYSNSKTQPSNTNNRSLSATKVSKLPIRTVAPLSQQTSSRKKSNTTTSIEDKAKHNTTTVSNNCIPSTTNTTMKKSICLPSATQLPLHKTRPRSTTASEKNHTKTRIPSLQSKYTRAVKSNAALEQMDFTSSESSIEGKQSENKLSSATQDDGYSTWSSIDVKDDAITNSTRKNETDNTQMNIGLRKTWFDTLNRGKYSENPVKGGMELKRSRKSEITMLSITCLCFNQC